MSSLSDFLGNAISSLKGEGQNIATSASSSLAQGNVGEALSSLTGATTQLAATLGSGGGTPFGDDFAGINKRGDAVQSWCWYAIMPDITNTSAVGVGSVVTPLGTINGSQPLVSLPWYYVQTGNLPLRTINFETFKRNGHDIHRAQSYNIGQLTLGFFMDSTSKAHQYLKAWQGLILGNANPKVVSNQGNWGYPSSYMKDITLVVLSVQRNLLLNVKFINCWPAEPQALDFTSGDAQPMVLNVNFVCEDVDITVNNDKGLLDTLTSTASGYGLSTLSSVLGDSNTVSSVLNNIASNL